MASISSIIPDIVCALIGCVALLVSHQRTHRLVRQCRSAPLILKYSRASQASCIVGWLIIASIKLYFGQDYPFTTLSDHIYSSAAATLYLFLCLSVLNYRLIISKDGVLRVSDFLIATRIDWRELKGARESTTPFFGGLTSFRTPTQRLTVRHQLVNAPAAIRLIRESACG